VSVATSGQPLSRMILGLGGWRALLATVAAVILATAVYTAAIGLQVGGDLSARIVDDLGGLAAGALAATLAGLRAVWTAPAVQRLGWALVCTYMAVYWLGDAIYTYYDLVLRVPVPVPSPADVTYLSGAAIGVGAVLVVTGRAWASTRTRSLLDGAIIAGALLALSWMTVLHSVYQQGGTSTMAFLVVLAYPVADVAAAGIVLSVISHTRRLDPYLYLILAGVLLLAVTDSAYTYLANLGLYQGGNPIDGGYFAAYLLIASAAAWGGGVAPEPDRPVLARWQLLLPYAPFIVACLIAAFALVSNQSLDRVAEIVIAIVVALILLRQLFAVVEAQSMSLRFDEASRGWERTATEREILIDQAPVGICRVDGRGLVLTANQALKRMLGATDDEFGGRSLWDLLQRDDHHVWGGSGAAGVDRIAAEGQLRRADGTPLWYSLVAIPLHGQLEQPEGYIAILEDTSERMREAEHAAEIQRQLLPQSPPEIAGYDVAGACWPAREVAGDFYDWTATDQHLDVTLADVMGKGMGPALVMAALCTALRTAPSGSGPATRVRRAAGSIALGRDEREGLFVTLFQGRLELATGRLRYVDAGHGYCVVRRANGQLVRLTARSLPLGVEVGEVLEEGEIGIAPGDILIVHSDGLVETPEHTADLGELLCDLDAREPAAETLRRLLGQAPDPIGDDVTVMVLRRLPVA
jgi:PAS domain S-box-containing protein